MLTKEEVKGIRRTHLIGESSLPRVFSVLGDSTRWYMLQLLAEYEDLCVTDLANVLEISVPAVSQHLKVMELSGLVRRERMGQMTCYRVQRDNQAVRLVMRLAKSIDT